MAAHHSSLSLNCKTILNAIIVNPEDRIIPAGRQSFKFLEISSFCELEYS